MRGTTTALAVLWIMLATTVCSQTTVNPDISAVGDFRTYAHNDKARDDERKTINLSNPDFELNIGGYVNPYVRADVIVGWHGEHNAEIEELYATILRGLPLGTNLRVGKYLLEFGRLNPVHPHAYSYIHRPLPHQLFFGEEGLSDMSLRASWLLPTGDTYTELMAGLLKGDALMGHDHEHEESASEHEEDEDVRHDLGFFGRLTTSVPLSTAAELSLGASATNAVYEVGHHEHDTTTDLEPKQMRAWLIGGDLKYKYRPSKYTALQIETEVILRRAEQMTGNDLTSLGAYGYVDYRFHQKYNLGAIVEFVRDKHGEEIEVDGESMFSTFEHDTWRAGLFAGFAPIEETSLVRLAGHWTNPDDGDGFWETTLQLVVGLGPHKPHNF
ncbi:MAG: hypothetical protein KKA42_05845 [candidate division Zixibacteria bacterium]|nr:hypothetical protein [candidate division Zixibacteria bacterium]